MADPGGAKGAVPPPPPEVSKKFIKNGRKMSKNGPKTGGHPPAVGVAPLGAGSPPGKYPSRSANEFEVLDFFQQPTHLQNGCHRGKDAV